MAGAAGRSTMVPFPFPFYLYTPIMFDRRRRRQSHSRQTPPTTDSFESDFSFTKNQRNLILFLLSIHIYISTNTVIQNSISMNAPCFTLINCNLFVAHCNLFNNNYNEPLLWIYISEIFCYDNLFVTMK